MFNEPLFKKRSLGDKIDVTFAFIRHYFWKILKMVSIVSIPFCCILSFIIVYDIAVNDVPEAFSDSWHDTLNSMAGYDTILTKIRRWTQKCQWGSCSHRARAFFIAGWRTLHGQTHSVWKEIIFPRRIF